MLGLARGGNFGGCKGLCAGMVLRWMVRKCIGIECGVYDYVVMLLYNVVQHRVVSSQQR